MIDTNELTTIWRKSDTGTWYVLRLREDYQHGHPNTYITACYGPIVYEDYIDSYRDGRPLLVDDWRERVSALIDTIPGTFAAARWANLQPWNY